jgi:hypothetical protein
MDGCMDALLISNVNLPDGCWRWRYIGRGNSSKIRKTKTTITSTATSTTITTTTEESHLSTGAMEMGTPSRTKTTTRVTTTSSPSIAASISKLSPATTLPITTKSTDVIDHLLRSGSSWTPSMLCQHLCQSDILSWPSIDVVALASSLPSHIYLQMERHITLLLQTVNGSPQTMTPTDNKIGSILPTLSPTQLYDSDASTGLASLTLSNESSSRLFLDAIILPLAAHCGIVLDVESTEKRSHEYPTNRRDYIFGRPVPIVSSSSNTSTNNDGEVKADNKEAKDATESISDTTTTSTKPIVSSSKRAIGRGSRRTSTSMNSKSANNEVTSSSRLLSFVLLEAKQRKALADMVFIVVSYHIISYHNSNG